MSETLNKAKSPIVTAWRNASMENWSAYTNHEFTRGLGDGTLPTAAFMAYLIQDYLFLIHFSRAWALAAVKSESVNQLRMTASTVNALINEEIQLHVKLCAEHGISEQQLNKAIEAPENLAYTRYVMDAGLTDDLLDLLAALAPCVFGYHEIACHLGDCDTLPMYQEWIDTYRADETCEVCDMAGELIDEVALTKLGENPTSSPRWPALCNRFAVASQLEANFWQMGIRLAQEAT